MIVFHLLLVAVVNREQISHAEKPMEKPYYLKKVENINALDKEETAILKKVSDRFAFRANNYYLSLIDWEDPDDPIRRIIIPDAGELEEWGKIDPSDEKDYTIIPGLQHKYNSTALLLVSKVCGGICRYCFRKRIFLNKQDDTLRDMPAALKYIKAHTEITNVLLTGGDPLILSTNRLQDIISNLFEIKHIKIIRIGTKLLSFNPHRVLGDPSLLDMIKRHTETYRKIYIMAHFSHPRELTDEAVNAATRLRESGAILVNQTPMIRRVNDDPEILAELFRRLSFIGVPPYYIFQCRPALGNKAYAVPIEEGYQIFENAKARVSGLAKRARFVMSHSTGKLEIVGMTDHHVYFKYHRAARDSDSGLFVGFERNRHAYWLDDYSEPVETIPVYSNTDRITQVNLVA